MNPASEITMRFYADSPAGRLLEQISDGMVNSESRRGISEYSRQFEFPVSELLAGARLNAGAGIDFGEKQGLSQSGEARVAPMNNTDAPQDVTQTMALPEPILNNFQAEETGANSVSLWSSFEKSVEGRLTSLFSEISRNVNFGGRTVVLSGSDTHSKSMRTVQNQVCITAPALRRILSRFSFETDIYSTTQHSNSDTALTSVVNETAELLRRYSFEEDRHQNSPETHIYQDYSFRETSGFSEKNTVHNSSTALTSNNAVQKENEEAPAHSTSKNTNHPTGAVLSPEPQSNAAQREQLTLPERSTSETVNQLTGTVLPPEPQSNAAQTELLTPLAQSETKNNERRTAGSYRDRLDNKTLSVIDQLIAETRQPIPVPEIKEAIPEPEPELNYISSEKSVEPSDVIRSVNIVRESIVRHTESHMSRLIERAYRNTLPEQPEKKPFTFRTAENTENMVMLVPPAEMDRYRAQQPYMNSLPPIELKEPQPAQAPAENSRTVTTNRQVTVNTSVDGGISSLTRDEISRLTDKVYERIENRLARERRRMGL